MDSTASASAAGVASDMYLCGASLSSKRLAACLCSIFFLKKKAFKSLFPAFLSVCALFFFRAHFEKKGRSPGFSSLSPPLTLFLFSFFFAGIPHVAQRKSVSSLFRARTESLDALSQSEEYKQGIDTDSHFVKVF
jgi:hypothetical protein